MNNSSRMYLLEGAGELHRNYGLDVSGVGVLPCRGSERRMVHWQGWSGDGRFTAAVVDRRELWTERERGKWVRSDGVTLDKTGRGQEGATHRLVRARQCVG